MLLLDTAFVIITVIQRRLVKLAIAVVYKIAAQPALTEKACTLFSQVGGQSRQLCMRLLISRRPLCCLNEGVVKNILRFDITQQ